jgi:hypothetical protein
MTIRQKIGPNPRAIADDIWAKLVWAGLNLTEQDLRSGAATYYVIPGLKQPQFARFCG